MPRKPITALTTPFVCPACDGEAGREVYADLYGGSPIGREFCECCNNEREVTFSTLDERHWHKATTTAPARLVEAALDEAGIVGFGLEFGVLVPMTAQDVFDGRKVSEWRECALTA
jgi:hypothetical protein